MYLFLREIFHLLINSVVVDSNNKYLPIWEIYPFRKTVKNVNCSTNHLIDEKSVTFCGQI